MGIVSKIGERRDIPHEPGEWMMLRRLSWRQLEHASDVQTAAQLEQAKRLGGEMVTALQKAAAGQKQDPAAGYDRATVLQFGITGWSYEAEATPENIDDLDPETADWAFREILAFRAPRTEDETKNG